MKVKYVSELGMEFDTPKEAIDHDKTIPRIIEVYEKGLADMEAGLETSQFPETNEYLKKDWTEKIERYKIQWADAQDSWGNYAS